MKHSIIRLCIIFLGTWALCLPIQAAFQEGYVVTLKGDTLYGDLDMSKPQSMMNHCLFRSKETGKTTRFKPKELKSFATVDLSRRFISGTVPYFLKDRLIFLEVLQAGRINLYFTYDAILNNLFYVSKRDAKLVDLMFDWDKNKLIPLKSDYVTFLKKIMVDAPELLSEIETIKTATPQALHNLVGRYNRRFEKTSLATTIPETPTVAIPKKRLGLSVAPGLVLPGVLDMNKNYIQGYCGLSLTKGPTKKRNGFYYSVGVYKPLFSVTTQFDDIRTLPPLNPFQYDNMVLVPVSASYRFLKNQLQPMIGLEMQNYLNNKNSSYVLGYTFGLNYTPIKWLTVSCSLQNILSVYEKVSYYGSISPYNMTTQISINF